jgi:hypothetical protein
MSYLSSCLRFVFFSLVVLLIAHTAQAADLAGTWTFALSTSEGDVTRTISFELEGQNVTGRLGEEVLKGTFKNGQLEMSGKHYAMEAGYESTLSFTGEFEGEQLKGNGSWDTYTFTFVATKTE